MCQFPLSLIIVFVAFIIRFGGRHQYELDKKVFLINSNSEVMEPEDFYNFFEE